MNDTKLSLKVLAFSVVFGASFFAGLRAFGACLHDLDSFFDRDGWGAARLGAAATCWFAAVYGCAFLCAWSFGRAFELLSEG
jgi:hypothetical protein